MKHRRSVWTISAIAAAGIAALAVAPVVAHPPDAPYDNTVFAPIEDESGIQLGLSIVASGFTAPLGAKRAPGDSTRFYVIDQIGKLWAVDIATGNKVVMLDVSSRLPTLGQVGPGSFDERGFLGVAFHPNYQSNRKFYTYTSEPNAGPPSFPTTMPPGSTADHQNVVAEWKAVDPANPAAGVVANSRRELMRVDWPQFNHDAGDIVFGPDGKLYIPMGDGGGADDLDGDLSFGPPGFVGHSGDGNAQKITVPLGKIHRIDVNGNNSSNGQYGIPSDNPFVNTAGAVKEIWAYGLRNPFRLSFDTASGALIAGDVGQNDIEEVNVIVKGGNYGWNRKEGTLCFDNRGFEVGAATADCSSLPPLPPDLIDPRAQYDTHHEGHSVIGGFVYHGSAIAPLQGRYVFAEWSRLFAFPNGPDNYGRILYIPSPDLHSGGGLRDIQEFQGFAQVATALGLTTPGQPPAAFQQTLSVLGMGQDSSGEVYVLGNKTGRPAGESGFLLKIIPAN
jgi:glucose/arabinose dehydrogenase